LATIETNLHIAEECIAKEGQEIHENFEMAATILSYNPVITP